MTDTTVDNDNDFPKLIAFYLPQFHRIPENDAWWGQGFTEWTNVTKAAPLFGEHYQPHLPADLGFYDLRVREAHHEQIALAKLSGIDAFCYHYYWFSGRRLLEAPLDAMLADKDAKMPFCLCWANENWTRRWDGAERHVLMEQQYLQDDPEIFVRDLMPYIDDDRYLRSNGQPILVVYAPQQIPHASAVVAEWRRLFREAGAGEVYLVAALTHLNSSYKKYGFDAGVQFPPHGTLIPSIGHEIPFTEPFSGAVFKYPEFAASFASRDYAEGHVYRCVVPSWDNTARVGSRGLMLLDGTPGNYEYWLKQAVARTQHEFPAGERLVFINAWNEWAEGCHLEPDRKYGRGFLEATLRVATAASELSDYPDQGPLPTWPVVASATRPPRQRLRYRAKRLVADVLRHFPRLHRIVSRVYRLLVDPLP